MFTLDNFYKSKEWEKILEILKAERVAADGFLHCEHCGQPIIRAYDCIGHHKEEITEENVNDYNISLNPDNIALVHHRCHNKIHERFGYEYVDRRVYLVYGSPCSGKSRYVEEVAGKNDLIVDIDKIYAAISTNPMYIKSPNISANVFKIRDELLDMVRTRYGRWKNAYIVGGYPLEGERERLAEKLGAHVLFVDTSKEECLKRAADDRPKEWIRYINDWWEKFSPPSH